MNQDNDLQSNFSNDQNQALQPIQDADLLNIDSDNIGNLQKTIISLPLEASDTDLIEKEWVNTLQEVVRHTSEDPYTQQLEISRVKADYMKKRYNKDVKKVE